MLDALLGAAIMVVATTSLLYSIEVAEKAFKDAGADMATALTLNYIDEGLGVATAAQKVGLPIVISFTVETDGRLPSGETLAEAIETIERTDSD